MFAFPLYVDGVPSQLLSCLRQIEKVGVPNKNTMVFGIANCGFYEGKQNEIAIEILRNWCNKLKLQWGMGMGIGVGGGGGLAQISSAPLGKGPKTTLGKVFIILKEHIESKTTSMDIYCSLCQSVKLLIIGGHILKITYDDTQKDLPSEQLHRLFVLVCWSGGAESSEQMEFFNIEFINSTLVISARDDERLVVAVRVLSDKIFRSVIYDLIVDPEYHNRGIGGELVKRCNEHFPNSEWLLQTTKQISSYYKKLGFQVNKEVFLTTPCTLFTPNLEKQACLSTEQKSALLKFVE